MTAETTYPATKLIHRRRKGQTLLHLKNAAATVEVWVRITPAESDFGNAATHFFTRPAGGIFPSLDEGWELDHSQDLPLDVTSAKEVAEAMLFLSA